MRVERSLTSRPSQRTVAVAAATQATLIAYFLVQNHVNLAPWNNLAAAGPQLRSTLVGVVPGVGVLAALLFGGPRVRRIAAIWSWVWLGLQLTQWWVPYLFDVHPLTRDGGQWYVDGGYERTVHLIPTEAGRVVPDAQHNVLQLLSLLAAIMTTVVAATTRGESRRASEVHGSRSSDQSSSTSTTRRRARLRPGRKRSAPSV